MRQIIYIGLLVASIAHVPFCFAQSNITLEDACYSDIELTENAAAMAGNSSPPDPDYFSVDEQAEINLLLASQDLIGATTQTKVGAVLQACAQGEILQLRYGTNTQN